jgi:DNA-binding response OmpR family regulator
MVRNILVIEDKQADAALIKYYLEEVGFQHTFFHTESLKEGIDIIQETDIDLVILDLSIRDSIGFKTLTKYLEEAPDVPVIVMTGMNNSVVGIQSVKAGAQDFLVKGDFDSRSLVKTIRYSLQRFKTQEKLRQQANQLSIQRQRSERAHEMARFANWEMDLVNNSMSWGDEMYRIFGFKPNAFQPALSDYLRYVHSEDKEAVHHFFENVIKIGAQQNIEHRILIDNRILKRIELTAKVNYDEVSNKILLIGSIQDITDRNNGPAPVKQNPKKQAPIRSIHQNTLNELSFNVRTPISSIVNLLFLLDNTNLSPQQKDLVNSLKTSFDDLSVVFHELINFNILVSDQAEIEEEAFDTQGFLKTYSRSLELSANKAKVTSKLITSSALPAQIISDEQKIIQLLNNIFNHATKYHEGDGPIVIEPRIKRNPLKENILEISVTFSGTTKSKNNLRELILQQDQLDDLDTQDLPDKRNFEKIIINKLIRAFNGKFAVLSGEENEVIIQIDLPVKVIEASRKQEEVKTPVRPMDVLLVEDHPINRIATKRLLTSWSDKLTVDIASDGQECLDKVSEKDYDLILMDIKMPNISGIEATIQIRKNSSIPIIALTANASKKEEEKCLAVGMNDYMVKPFNPNDLYARIKKLENSN